jgi:hypothetical protein
MTAFRNGVSDESTGFGQAYLQALQGDPAQARGADHLQGSPAQAAPGLRSVARVVHRTARSAMMNLSIRI